MIEQFLAEYGYKIAPGASVEWSRLKSDYRTWLAASGADLQVAQFRHQLTRLGVVIGAGPTNRVICGNLGAADPPRWVQNGERVKLVK